MGWTWARLPVVAWVDVRYPHRTFGFVCLRHDNKLASVPAKSSSSLQPMAWADCVSSHPRGNGLKFNFTLFFVCFYDTVVTDLWCGKILIFHTLISIYLTNLFLKSVRFLNQYGIIVYTGPIPTSATDSPRELRPITPSVPRLPPSERGHKTHMGFSNLSCESHHSACHHLRSNFWLRCVTCCNPKTAWKNEVCKNRICSHLFVRLELQPCCESSALLGHTKASSQLRTADQHCPSHSEGLEV